MYSRWLKFSGISRVAVLTGEGRLFCAGADLKEYVCAAFFFHSHCPYYSLHIGQIENTFKLIFPFLKPLWYLFFHGNSCFMFFFSFCRWNKDEQAGRSTNRQRIADNKDGFGSVSRRQSNKPIIAAVNGGAYGGGMEIVVNCDLVVTEEHAKFGFTEVSRGVVVTQGAIPRLIRIAGHQVSCEFLSFFIWHLFFSVVRLSPGERASHRYLTYLFWFLKFQSRVILTPNVPYLSFFFSSAPLNCY